MKFIDKILDILYPDGIKCLVCKSELESNGDFCKDCQKEITFNNKNICQHCGTQIECEGVCPICQSSKKVYEIARAPFLYEGHIKNLIHSFKYDNAKFLFEPLAKYMIEEYRKNNYKADLIVPIPLNKDRLKERGYNQAKLLAEEIGKQMNIPVCECLERIKATPSQVNLTFKERQKNVENAFRIKDKAYLRKRILLIDDVYTSGATIKEACNTLKGAGKIYVLTLAHTKI